MGCASPSVLLAVLFAGLVAVSAASPFDDLTWWQIMALSTGQKMPPTAFKNPPLAAPQHRPLHSRKVIIGTENLIISNGYPVESHEVETKDGYLLTMFRIPNPGRPPVFLQHGLLASSADWVVMGKGRALAFMLYDAGYDVWMGNNRGNTASRKHKKLRPSQAKFWDFSWHEIGLYDLPAELDWVLAATNQSQLHYVGHSQGTTSFFVMGSERPEYMAKIKTFTGLAPIAYLRDVKSLPVRVLAVAPNAIASIIELVGMNELLPSSRLIRWLGKHMCGNKDLTQPICSNIIFLTAGADPPEMNMDILDTFLCNTPAGSSTKQFHHYGQLVNQKNLVFRKFDYGIFGNLWKYRKLTPPDYDLSKITPPTYLFHSDNDLMCSKTNVDKLTQTLPNIAENGVRKVALESWNHLDFTFGWDANTLVYNQVLDIINNSEKTSK